MTIFVSLTLSRTEGFKKWSDNHRPNNHEEDPSDATAIALAGTPHRPWVIPEVGGAF